MRKSSQCARNGSGHFGTLTRAQLHQRQQWASGTCSSAARKHKSMGTFCCLRYRRSSQNLGTLQRTKQCRQLPPSMAVTDFFVSSGLLGSVGLHVPELRHRSLSRETADGSEAPPGGVSSGVSAVMELIKDENSTRPAINTSKRKGGTLTAGSCQELSDSSATWSP